MRVPPATSPCSAVTSSALTTSPGASAGNARRVGRHELGADAADRLGEGHALARREERLARRHDLLVERAPRGRDARRLAEAAAVLVDGLGQRRREMADARLVVADRQQRHDRPPVGALEADAARIQRAVDRDAVGQGGADVDDQLERIARADRGVREHAVVEQPDAVDRADQLARQPGDCERAVRSSCPRPSKSARERSIEPNRLADGLVVSSTSKAASRRPRSR